MFFTRLLTGLLSGRQQRATTPANSLFAPLVKRRQLGRRRDLNKTDRDTRFDHLAQLICAEF